MKLLAEGRRDGLPEQVKAQLRDDEETGEDADDDEVATHVVLVDEAELVRDEGLQFVAGELLQRPAGHAQGEVILAAGREGVDARVAFEHVALRHGHRRGQGHLLDDIEELAQLGIRRPPRDHLPAQGEREEAAAAGELLETQPTRHGDHDGAQPRGPEEDERVPARERARLRRRGLRRHVGDGDPGLGLSGDERDSRGSGLGQGRRADLSREAIDEDRLEFAGGVVAVLHSMAFDHGLRLQREPDQVQTAQQHDQRDQQQADQDPDRTVGLRLGIEETTGAGHGEKADPETAHAHPADNRKAPRCAGMRIGWGASGRR